MDLGLRGKVAVVTGGANGIGAGICERLCAEGASIVVVDINGQKAEQTAASLREKGFSAVSHAADIANEDAVNKLAEMATGMFGEVHILVNNAGFTRDMRITKMAASDWDAVQNVVLRATFLCSRAFVPIFAKANWGRIVNMSSRAHLGNPGQVNYSAAKAGIIGFTRALSLEVGRNNITVNAVAPGIIDTDAVRGLPHFEKIRENAEKTTPISRIGKVEDVADIVAFLSSQRAAYITGEVVHVTGGRY